MMNKISNYTADEIGQPITTHINDDLKIPVTCIYNLKDLLNGIGSNSKPKNFSDYYLRSEDTNNLIGITDSLEDAITSIKYHYQPFELGTIDWSSSSDINNHYYILVFNRSYYIVRKD